MPFDSIEDALEDIRQGKMIIVADDENRENEGDLVCAASLSGLCCVCCNCYFCFLSYTGGYT